MKIKLLQDKKIMYVEKTSEKHKGHKRFMAGAGLAFIIVGAIFLIILFFGSIWLGEPSNTQLGIVAGITIFIVGVGFILIGIIFIIRGYTIVDLTIYDSAILLPVRSLGQVIRKEVDILPFDDIERVYLNIKDLPPSAYLSRDRLLAYMPRFLPPAVRREINNGKIKGLKLRKGIGQPKEGDVIILLKNGDYEIISEIDIENRNNFNRALENLKVGIIK